MHRRTVASNCRLNETFAGFGYAVQLGSCKTAGTAIAPSSTVEAIAAAALRRSGSEVNRCHSSGAKRLQQ
ncbi:hypothetical protein [Rubidibacter lacunae]|uniref:hypothetical protein n=1 Tax=Rubidibacter lacunae TaxID=582514 RepID=UPI000404EC4B|nr:hypothetical protein [Rubidibacter lacunae]